MPISFNTIPSTLRVPLFYAEMDNSKAGTFSATYRALLCGQISNTLYTDVDKPVLISSTDQAKSKFGPGSQLAQMVEGYLDNNTSVASPAPPPPPAQSLFISMMRLSRSALTKTMPPPM